MNLRPLFFLLLCFFAFEARAETRFADMVEEDRLGHEMGDWTLLRLSFIDDTSFKLEEGWCPVCQSQTPCPNIGCWWSQSSYDIERSDLTDCGSRRYVTSKRGSTAIRMVVIDHTEALCGGHHKYSWKVILREPQKATRFLFGNLNSPEPRDE